MQAVRLLRWARKLWTVALTVAFVLFFVATYLGHDVWKVSLALQLPIWGIAVGLPVVLALAVERVVRRASSQAASAALAERVRPAVAKSAGLEMTS